MSKRFILEKQTGHSQDPGNVKWQQIDRFYLFYVAKTIAQVLNQQRGYAETDLRIYDSEKDEVIWSNF